MKKHTKAHTAGHTEAVWLESAILALTHGTLPAYVSSQDRL